MAKSKITIRTKFNRLPEIAAKLPDETSKIVSKGIHDIDAHAASMTPVDTGYLKNSKTVEVKATKGTIHWPAEYAAHVNYGTYKMEARPFATDAFAKVSPSIEQAFRELEAKL